MATIDDDINNNDFATITDNSINIILINSISITTINIYCPFPAITTCTPGNLHFTLIAIIAYLCQLPQLWNRCFFWLLIHVITFISVLSMQLYDDTWASQVSEMMIDDVTTRNGPSARFRCWPAAFIIGVVSLAERSWKGLVQRAVVKGWRRGNPGQEMRVVEWLTRSSEK